MAGALEDAQVGAPGADGGAVLVGEEAGYLVKVGEVMHGPGGEKLRQGDGAEGGMGPAQGKLLWGEVECAEVAEVGRAELGEFIQELGERLACTVALLGEAVQRLEGAGLAMGEDRLGAGHPVGALAVVQMAKDVVGAPGAGAFVFEGPGCGEIAQEGVEGGGRAGEEGDCVVEVVVHWGSCFGCGPWVAGFGAAVEILLIASARHPPKGPPGAGRRPGWRVGMPAALPVPDRFRHRR